MDERTGRLVACGLAALTFSLAACGGGSTEPPPPPPPAAVIVVQPSDQTVGAGTTATFTVSATDATGYQWQRRSPGGATFADVSGATTPSHTTTATQLADDGARYRVVVSGAASSVTSAVVTLTVQPVSTLPPDPASVASPVDPTVATDLFQATAFLYTGASPIQSGVVAGTIDPRRVAVLRGRVLDRAGAVLTGVEVNVLGHPELGRTFSRADGAFDLAVNGGSQLTVQFQKEGFLPVQRAADVPWRDYTWLPDVALSPLDAAVTSVDLSAATLQVARGSSVTDADGTRQATVLFAPGTTATMVLAGGVTQPLTSLHVRATEFTVGGSGPRAMPATLPPASGYTYAAELSVDEALAAGASEVRFSQPVPVYLENFLGFPVGSPVPAGHYDRQAGRWLPAPNGRVIEVLAVTAGQAALDTDGDGLADDAPALAALGITPEERTRLGTLYAAGQTLWRVPVQHFSAWDFNWPFAPPPGAISPPAPRSGAPIVGTPREECGSVIGCEDQTLGESVPVAGTPWRLHYRSDRVPGRTAERQIVVALSGAAPLPAGLKRIELEISVAGRKFAQTFAAAPGQSSRFTWDGQDAYGRTLQGVQSAAVTVGYVYGGVYLQPSERRALETDSEAFGHFSYLGNPVSANRDRAEVTLLRSWTEPVGLLDARGLGMGGWSLSLHHAYDPTAPRLYLGDGRQRAGAGAAQSIVVTVAGSGLQGFGGDQGPATRAGLNNPSGVAASPDGSLYVADTGNQRIRRVGPDGVITTVAGTGVPGFAGDGGPATAAQLFDPQDVAVGADGSLYVADYDNHRVRRVGPDGLISTVAGSGVAGFSGDGGPASGARLNGPSGVAVDADGTLFIADSGNHRIRRVGPDGTISTVTGDGFFQSTGDGGPAAAAQVAGPKDVALGPDGALFIAEYARLRRVGPDGIISTVAGTGVEAFGGDGGPATAAQLTRPTGIAVGPDGSLYLADRTSYRIRRIGGDGVISTIAGQGTPGNLGEGGPATAVQLADPTGVCLGPDGTLYVADRTNRRILRIQSALGVLGGTDLLFPSEDGQELHVLDAAGHHRQTFDTRTGALRYAFGYDAGGYLTSITDGSGNVATIERLGAAPIAVVAPGGQRTALAVDLDGWLSAVTDPAGATHATSHSTDGLLQTFTDPRGNIHRFTYDALGRLAEDQDPAGGSTSLVRTEQADGYTVTTMTRLGRTRGYQVQGLPTGVVRRTFTAAGGATEVTLRATDGSEQTTFADGSSLAVTYGPDPRWGMLAPVTTRAVLTTPGGHTRTVTRARATVLAAPTDPLSATDLTEIITDNGAVRTQVYRDDGVTRTLTDTSAAGRATTWTLDALGRITQVDVPGLDPVAYAYDGKGLLTTITEGSGAGSRVTSLAHDAALQLTGVTDPLGRTLALDHDAAGRPVSLALPGSRTVTLASDASGNTTEVTPPGRSTTHLAYTALDQLAGATPPSVGAGSTATAFLYDADRALASVTRPDGRTVTVTSDAAGRTAAVGIARGSVSYSYDAADRLVGVAAPGAIATAYGYDGALLTGVTWSGPVAGATAYTHDAWFRLAGETVNGGGPVAYRYDADGLLTQAGDLALVHDAQNGLLRGATVGSLSEAWTYDPAGRVSGYTAGQGPTTLYGASLTRDALGRITGKVETVEGTSTSWGYGYDAAGRLAAVTRDGSAFSSYSYDQNGNRTARTGPVVASASTDAQDRLSSHGGSTYVHAASGELQRRTTGGQVTSYAYDELGGLLQVTLPGGSTIDYLVEGEGRRIGKVVDGVRVQGFLYQGPGRVVAELDGANAVVSRFVYATRVNVPDYLVRGGATYRVITDHLGSPRLVVDVQTGALAQRIDYDEFGRILTDTNPGFQPFGFAGGLYDAATGLVRFGARDYDAEAGRWTAKDPIGYAGMDTNLYAYASGDPVNVVDLDGRAGSCRPLFVRSKDTRLLGTPEAGALRQNGVLQPGAMVTFDGFDPSGQFAHVRALLPDGRSVEGFILNQNLSRVPPPSEIPATEGRAFSPQAYSSSGVGIKG